MMNSKKIYVIILVSLCSLPIFGFWRNALGALRGVGSHISEGKKILARLTLYRKNNPLLYGDLGSKGMNRRVGIAATARMVERLCALNNKTVRSGAVARMLAQSNEKLLSLFVKYTPISWEALATARAERAKWVHNIQLSEKSFDAIESFEWVLRGTPTVPDYLKCLCRKKFDENFLSGTTDKQ